MNSEFAANRNPPEYYTIATPETAQIKIKGSRFMGHALPAESVETCETIIDQQRRKFHDASHVCYGYSIGIGDQAVVRSSDAGEPSGSAGAPIVNVIMGEGLTNILITVVRYFGGTKLGIGGLIQAYTEITKAVLAKTQKIRKVISTTIEFQIAYDHLNQTLRELDKLNAGIMQQDYSEHVVMTVSIPVSEESNLRERLATLTSGSVQFIS